jgi:hypothetical protein
MADNPNKKKADGKRVSKQPHLVVDYERDDIPQSAKLLKPLVYQEGDNVCVVLGPDPTEGVFGCGSTEQEALLDWDKHLQEQVAASTAGDEVAQHIKNKLNETH